MYVESIAAPLGGEDLTRLGCLTMEARTTGDSIFPDINPESSGDSDSGHENIFGAWND